MVLHQTTLTAQFAIFSNLITANGLITWCDHCNCQDLNFLYRCNSQHEVLFCSPLEFNECKRSYQEGVYVSLPVSEQGDEKVHDSCSGRHLYPFNAKTFSLLTSLTSYICSQHFLEADFENIGENEFKVETLKLDPG